MRIRCVFLTVTVFGMGVTSFGQYIGPTLSASLIDLVAPTTRPWYESDDSLMSLNAGLGAELGFENADWMIRNMKDGLIGEQCPLASTSSGTRKYITEISDALYRSGDSPEITNTLHQSLFIPEGLAKPLACRCGTGILPVFHGRDAHATRGFTRSSKHLRNPRMKPETARHVVADKDVRARLSAPLFTRNA